MVADARLTVVVPMKPLAEAKSRLAPCLPLERRAALSLLMLARVLLSARQAPSVWDTWVVGGDHAVLRLSGALGAQWFPEPGNDLNDSLGRAFAGAFHTGAQAVLFLPGDMPLLTSASLEALVEASQGLERLVVAPAARDEGTNALLLLRGRPLWPLLGPSSFQRHMEALRERGYPLAVHRAPELAFDVDTPEDWRLLASLRPDLAQSLPQWEVLHRLIASSGVAPAGVAARD